MFDIPHFDLFCSDQWTIFFRLKPWTILLFQTVGKLFNKALIMNAAFEEVKKMARFDCYIFHDVDLLPEDDRNLYVCTQQPRHVAAYIDKFHYQWVVYSINTSTYSADWLPSRCTLSLQGFQHYFWNSIFVVVIFETIVHWKLTVLFFKAKIRVYRIIIYTVVIYWKKNRVNALPRICSGLKIANFLGLLYLCCIPPKLPSYIMHSFPC